MKNQQGTRIASWKPVNFSRQEESPTLRTPFRTLQTVSQNAPAISQVPPGCFAFSLQGFWRRNRENRWVFHELLTLQTNVSTPANGSHMVNCSLTIAKNVVSLEIHWNSGCNIQPHTTRQNHIFIKPRSPKHAKLVGGLVAINSIFPLRFPEMGVPLVLIHF